MTTPTEYREIAEECMEAMRCSSTPEIRAELLRLAFRWNDLADEIDHRYGRQVLGPWSQTQLTRQPAPSYRPPH
jgi:hypothetical protein